MQKSSLDANIKKLMKYEKDDILDFNSPIQRASSQWNNLQKSLLIHSMLVDGLMPNVYFRKDKLNNKNHLSVIEGKQRLTTVFEFIDGKFRLHKKTPPVVLDDFEYDVSLSEFSDLNIDLQNIILQYKFLIYQIEDATDEEIEEAFARLNNGTALSKIQQSRPKLGMELADWCNRVVQDSVFFQNSLNLTLAMLRREDDFLMLLTTMMLLERNYKDGFVIKTSASASECVRFAESIRGNYPADKRETIELLVTYLDEAFKGVQYKFLRKNNVPIIAVVGQVALDKGIPAEDYGNAIIEFFENDCTEEYNEASGSGNVKMVNVNIRLMELLKAVATAFPDKIDVPVLENNEVNSELPSSVASEEVIVENNATGDEENMSAEETAISTAMPTDEEHSVEPMESTPADNLEDNNSEVDKSKEEQKEDNEQEEISEQSSSNKKSGKRRGRKKKEKKGANPKSDGEETQSSPTEQATDSEQEVSPEQELNPEQNDSNPNPEQELNPEQNDSNPNPEQELNPEQIVDSEQKSDSEQNEPTSEPTTESEVM